MDLPEFDKSEVPQEVIDKVGEDFEIVPLEHMDDYEPNVDPKRDAYLTRKIHRQLDEMTSLQNVHNKKLNKTETWKEVKKVARYYKSSLYAIRSIDKTDQV